MSKLIRPSKQKEDAVLSLYRSNILTIKETAFCLGMSVMSFRKYYKAEIDLKRESRNKNAD